MNLRRTADTIVLAFLLLNFVTAEENEMDQSKMLGPRTLAYEVSDMTLAIEWYTKAFGIAPYFESPEYAGFSIRGFELGLMPESNSSMKGTNIQAYWGVDDVSVEFDRLIELGAIAHTPIVDVGGGIRLGSVKDPFGNILGIVYNPVFKQE